MFKAIKQGLLTEERERDVALDSDFQMSGPEESCLVFLASRT